MWYFAWILGIGFAILLSIVATLWGENEEMRYEALNLEREQAGGLKKTTDDRP